MLGLRPYKKEDAKEILSWTNDEISFYKWSAGVLGSYPIGVEQFNKVQENMAFTAINEEESVGFLMMRNPNQEMEHIRFCFVIINPKYRSQGQGKQMLELALKYAFEIYGAKKVSLGVFDNNLAAYHCYKSVGFKEVESNKTYSIFNETWNCIEMEIIGD